MGGIGGPAGGPTFEGGWLTLKVMILLLESLNDSCPEQFSSITFLDSQVYLSGRPFHMTR